MKLDLSMVPKLNTQFHRFFPKATQRALWEQIEPRRYPRKIEAFAACRTFLMAFVLYAPGLRTIARAGADTLKTAAFNTLSYVLRRVTFLQTLQAAVRVMVGEFRAQPGDLVALDSMAVTLLNTQRHGCKKFNNTTVGGGILWGWNVSGRPGQSPMQVLRVIPGAWSDTRQARGIALLARGPVYLMDRGFWALALIREWLRRGTHFILRVNKSQLKFKTVKVCGVERWVGDIWVERDEIADFGAATRKDHPRVRLIVAWLPNSKDLILASDLLDWSAERILAAYKKRWQIERFHKFVKQGIGLAHLYSFQQRGLESLLYLCALLTLLLWFTLQSPANGAAVQDTVGALAQVLRDIRWELGLFDRWRPNVPHNHRSIKQSKRIQSYVKIKNH